MIRAKDAAFTLIQTLVASALLALSAVATPGVAQMLVVRMGAIWAAARNHPTGVDLGLAPPTDPGDVQNLVQPTGCATAPDGNRAHAQKRQATS